MKDAQRGRASAKKHQGQLELTWTNKDKALLSTGDGRYDYEFVDPTDYRVNEVRLLHEIETVEAPTPGERPADLPAPTADNLLITGDAMHALTALRQLPEYAEKYLGKVKLVYIDPPFNTGQTFNNYEDNIEHSVWLTMMRDRLEQIKDLISEDGSVWVHLDDVEVHRCRAVMDEVFGPDKFVAEVVWQKTDSSRNDAARVSKDHDIVLVYAKTSAFSVNRAGRSDRDNVRFSNPDEDPNGPWFDDNPTAPGARTNPGMVYAIQHPISGEFIYPSTGRCWYFSQDKMLGEMSQYADYVLKDLNDDTRRGAICGVPEGSVREGVKAVVLSDSQVDSAAKARARLRSPNLPEILIRSGRAKGFGKKSYIPDRGKVPTTWWANGDVGHNRAAKAEIKSLFGETTIFDTPKPERLLQRIIHIATNPGDIVLDCFGGSGTTAAVAHKMSRRWVTVELQDKTAETFTKPRLAKVVRGQDPGGITTTTKRVAVDELPDGLLPEDAQKFNTLLKKVLDTLDDADVETVKSLRAATRTRDETTVNWHGGGGFTHVRVGESMFTEVGERVYLSDWAVSGALTKAMCAQLGVRHTQDGIFAGRKGRVRYVVLDGMVTEATVSAILDQLPGTEIVEIWSTQVDPDAVAHLKSARPGSSLSSIPTTVLDTYRRKAARKSPFRSKKQDAA